MIESIVGSGPNVIHSISTYFTEGKADPSKTNTLAVGVAQFLDQVNTDANAITAWEEGAPALLLILLLLLLSRPFQNQR